MNLKQYNQTELAALDAVRDGLKWHLGVELGRDPSEDSQDMLELEMRLAKWLLEDKGGQWLAQFPKINN